jgi:hypothetical protein
MELGAAVRECESARGGDSVKTTRRGLDPAERYGLSLFRLSVSQSLITSFFSVKFSASPASDKADTACAGGVQKQGSLKSTSFKAVIP